MDIHFCDLCNESVPASDLAAGRAVRRKGRVVCAACDRAMGSAHLVAGGAPSFASPTPPPGPRPAASSRSGSGGIALAVAALAVLAAGLGILLVVLESNRRSEQWNTANEKRTELRTDLRRSIATVDGRVTFALEETGRHLEELSTGIDGQFVKLGGRMDDLRDSIDASVDRLDRFERDLRAAREDLGERDDEIAARLDGIVLAAVKEREQQESMRERLVDLEELVHSGAVAPPPSEEDLDAPPAWQVALDDLSSRDSAVRWNGVQALAESGDPAVVPYLVPLLQDSDIWVRMAAAGALGDLGATEAVGALIDALSDSETAVRERAMLSLRSITGRSFRFDPGGTEAERQRAIEKWREWWKDAGGELAAD